MNGAVASCWRILSSTASVFQTRVSPRYVNGAALVASLGFEDAGLHGVGFRRRLGAWPVRICCRLMSASIIACVRGSRQPLRAFAPARTSSSHERVGAHREQLHELAGVVLVGALRGGVPRSR